MKLGITFWPSCYDLDPLHHYVVTREDLPLGMKAAQIIHAAGESSPGDLPEGTYAIALQLPDEEALCDLAIRLMRGRVKFWPIFEPDAPYRGALMAIGIAPGRKEDLRRHLSGIPLLK